MCTVQPKLSWIIHSTICPSGMAIIVSEEIQKGTIQAEANYEKEIACQIDLI